MCGIAGLVRWSGLEPADEACAARFPRLLAHRGPDGAGTYRDAICTLAQSRLALIGPEMPLPHRAGNGRYTIAYNGEVYNYTSLDSNSDTEGVLAAWLEWGPAMFSRLRGMFSFFIWDAVARRGFAAVDPLGVKPFVFHRSRGLFAFASEAGVLIESGAVVFAPDEEAIAEHLAAPYFSSAQRLPFQGIERLQPGHSLTIAEDRFDVEPYFCFQHSRVAMPDPDAFLERLAIAAECAVSAASQTATSTVGCFLSGGVDSSLMTVLAGPQTPAWTIAYAGDDSADYQQSLIVNSSDHRFARAAAEHIGCPHHIVDVDDARFEAALLRTLTANDLICAWEQEVSQQLLAEAAAAHGTKAVLVGDAADETHFGYSFLLNGPRIASPGRILEVFGIAPIRPTLLDNPAAHFDGLYRRFAEARGYSWTSESEQRMAMTCLIQQFWLTRLLHNGDIHLMHHSLEGRVPFADPVLLALAQELTPEVGFRNGIEKWHLRKVAERYLPPEIAWRPKSALTKNLHAQGIIYRHLRSAWRTHGALIERYVDADAVDRLGPPSDERATGICFRMLALMKWFERFA